MKNNCPCCKITNALQEYRRHPSITSFKSLESACVRFNSISVDTNTVLISGCAHHSDSKRLGNWFDVLFADARKVLEQGFVFMGSAL